MTSEPSNVKIIGTSLFTYDLLNSNQAGYGGIQTPNNYFASFSGMTNNEVNGQIIIPHNGIIKDMFLNFGTFQNVNVRFTVRINATNTNLYTEVIYYGKSFNTNSISVNQNDLLSIQMTSTTNSTIPINYGMITLTYYMYDISTANLKYSINKNKCFCGRSDLKDNKLVIEYKKDSKNLHSKKKCAQKNHDKKIDNLLLKY